MLLRKFKADGVKAQKWGSLSKAKQQINKILILLIDYQYQDFF